MRNSLRLTAVAAVCLLSACSSVNDNTQGPTLKTLAAQSVDVKPDEAPRVSEGQAMQAYQQLLHEGGNSPLGAEALRRLYDLEMNRVDQANAESKGDKTVDYRAVIAGYQEQLASYPNAPNRDQVLYQLARAQEQAGELEAAQQTLTTLAHDFPYADNIDEIEFRRGELSFSIGRYADAEKSYSAVLSNDRPNPYRERATYMLGWSEFKIGQFDNAAQAFFKVLDAKLASRPGSDVLASPDKFNRADRELLADTFRGISLSLDKMKGAEGIEVYTAAKPIRQTYGLFVYEQLGAYYLKQNRPKDAADTYALFVKRHPLNGQAPRLQAQAVDNYLQANLPEQAMEAKRQYVVLFGQDSPLHMARARDWRMAQPQVQAYLKDLTVHYHAKAQSTKRKEDYQEAIRWYRELLSEFPNDKDAAHNNFLLAELLSEAGLLNEAAVEFEHVAYDYSWNPQAAEAGYAALLTRAQMRKGADPLDATRLQQASVTSALRFAKTFPGNERTASVLGDALEQLYALKDFERANLVAMKLIDLKPPASEAQRRLAWSIMAQTAWKRNAYGAADQAYTKMLEMTSPQDPAYASLKQTVVSVAYKFGEQERKAGHFKEAAARFKLVSESASDPTVRANALFDAGAAQFEMKDWAAARASLEDFRRRYPKHPLQADVGSKLAVIYSEQGEWSLAAAEMERILAAGGVKDATLAHNMLWQVAGYHEKAGERAAAAKAYERYLNQSLAMRPVPLENTIETRARLAQLAKDAGDTAREQAWTKQIYEADLQGGDARTDRTRYLGAKAALALAEPLAQAYRKVALVEPLQKQLKLKKAKLEEALHAYALASEPGVAEVSTEVTYQVADLYRDFGKAILGSQRPKKLSDVELEQYNVLLEEQALPFEEKSSDMHEVNARRAAQGVYDQWVQRSFDALAEQLPVRYGKRERGEGVSLAVVPADQLAKSTQALLQTAARSATPAVSYNQLGVHYRQLGQFDNARAAYERALAADPQYAPAVLNLGILSDLYLGDAERALSMYQRYLDLTPQGDPTVAKWIADLKHRLASSQPTPHKEAS